MVNMNRQEKANLCLIAVLLIVSVYTLNHALPFVNIFIKGFIFLCLFSCLFYVYKKDYQGEKIE